MSRDETPDTTGLREVCGYDGWRDGTGFCRCGRRFDTIQDFDRHIAHPTPDASPDPAVVTPDAGDVVRVLTAHILHASMNVCLCGEWRAVTTTGSLAEQHRAHVAQAIANYVAAAREADRAEVADLRHQLAELNGALSWDTTCLNCSQLLSASYAEYSRAEAAEERLAGLVAQIGALADEWKRRPDDTAFCGDHARDLRALIPADAATALDAVREKAKAEERERIAQVIETENESFGVSANPYGGAYDRGAHQGLSDAACIARTPEATS